MPRRSRHASRRVSLQSLSSVLVKYSPKEEKYTISYIPAVSKAPHLGKSQVILYIHIIIVLICLLFQYLMALLLVICLVLAGAIQAASFSRAALSLAPRLNANELIDGFIDSLGLQKEQVQVVHDYLAKDSNLAAYLGHGSYDSTQLATTACGTLEILLGRDSVDTSPVDKTIVEESW
jgi:hypothetical protein